MAPKWYEAACIAAIELAEVFYIDTKPNNFLNTADARAMGFTKTHNPANNE